MGISIDLFLEPSRISQEFLCSICQDVLQEPILLEPCEHAFCRVCIEEWRARSDTCPSDRQYIYEVKKPPRIYMNLLNALELTCSFTEDGCQASLTVGDFEEHQNQCDFNPAVPKQCTGGCGLKLTRAQATNHSCVAYLKNELRVAHELVRSSEEKLKAEKDEVKSLKDKLKAERDKRKKSKEKIKKYRLANLASYQTRAASRSAAVAASLAGLPSSSSTCGTGNEGGQQEGPKRSKPCPLRFKPSSATGLDLRLRASRNAILLAPSGDDNPSTSPPVPLPDSASSPSTSTSSASFPSSATTVGSLIASYFSELCQLERNWRAADNEFTPPTISTSAASSSVPMPTSSSETLGMPTLTPANAPSRPTILTRHSSRIGTPCPARFKK